VNLPPPSPPSKVARLPGPGSRVGDYELVAELGRGGVGAVFEARHVETRDRVAIKILLPSVMGERNITARFDREIRVASSLQSPYTVRLHEWGVHGDNDRYLGLPWFSMEFLRGVALSDYLERHGAMTIEESVGVMVQVLESLDEAHSGGIIHRDIKPHNIFLAAATGAPCVVKVLDFGTARAVTGAADEKELERLTATGMVAGTPQFMAPEQAEGQRDLTPAVDVYAAGCVWYQLLTGQPLYSGFTAYEVALKHVTEAIPPMPASITATPLGDLLHHNLAKEPAARHPDARTFLEALRKASADGGLDTTITPVALPGIAPRPLPPDATVPTISATYTAPTHVPSLPGQTAPRSPQLLIVLVLAAVAVALSGVIAALLLLG
jgi:eukaryotic-like serine/threonine-protein kinase